ncbi:MAG: endonuclease/exonuclease/phosphatase family protein [Bacteroidales bacterium]|nr:endonuclease/exonuclease/phosphatase family protein [Bacteroidota bacterium]MBL6950655.1 endonuclease/exonuclease/phosphatase family protein [Bacteroidales bacterium]
MAARKRTSWLILVNILLLLNIGAVISIFCSYAAHYIDPHDYWIFALFGLLYPWILILNLAFILLWLILWKRYALLSIIAILIGWNQLNTMIAINYETPVIPPAQNMSLITYNVHGFTGEANVKIDFRAEIIEYIAGEHPDILCLQEFHIREADTTPVIRKCIKAWDLRYHYMTNYYRNRKWTGINGIATFSRYPIVRTGILEHQPSKHFAIYTDIVMEYDTLRLFNVHLASLRLGQHDVNFYYQLKKNETENVNIKQGFFSILRKLKTAFILRAKQSEILLQAIENSPYPVLVCGDLNDSPFSYTYHELTQNLTDSYKEAGTGFFGSTYDGVPPNYRIDYILHDRHFRVFTYKKSNVTFSDHYPVSGMVMFNY